MRYFDKSLPIDDSNYVIFCMSSLWTHWPELWREQSTTVGFLFDGLIRPEIAATGNDAT